MSGLMSFLPDLPRALPWAGMSDAFGILSSGNALKFREQFASNTN